MDDLLRKQRFSRPVTEAAVADDWRGRGYSCHRFIDGPGQQWNDFVHDTNELVTVEDGRLRLFIGDVSIELGPGDEAFIPRQAVHSVHNIHSGTTRWLFGYD